MKPNGEVELRRYVLPHVRGEGWAIVVIGSDGYFSVCSDFGNYAYIWGEPGMEFRAFLTKIDQGYTAMKLSNGRKQEYQGERTYENIKEYIFSARREGQYDKERAREEWDLLARFDRLDDEYQYILWGQETKIESFYEYAAYAIPRDVRSFCEHILPRFQAMLKAELAAEAAELERAKASLTRERTDPRCPECNDTGRPLTQLTGASRCGTCGREQPAAG